MRQQSIATKLAKCDLLVVMALRIKPMWHLLVLIAAGTVLALNGGAVMDQLAWRGGTETSLGHIDSVQPDIGFRRVRFSYPAAGTTFQSEFRDLDTYEVGMPATVTYARSKPQVSTLDPDQLEQRMKTSVLAFTLALLPVLMLWGLEAQHKLRPSPKPAQERPE